MPILTPTEEQTIKQAIRRGEHSAFSSLFTLFYRDLVLFAGRYISSKELCEDIVQSVFLRLWDDHDNIVVISSLKAFLIQSVKNSCLDQIRHNSVVYRHQDYVKKENLPEDMNTYEYVLYSELSEHLQRALDKVPSECREAFEMNRFRGMNYKTIADKCHVSERTIEVRIGKTLQILRRLLKDFYILIIMLSLKI